MKNALLPSLSRPLSRLALPALLASFTLFACAGDDERTGGPRCGDGFCSGEETEESCPRDCPSVCVPGTQRCAGNVLLVCQSDGMSEIGVACQPGQFCTPEGCQTSPGPGPDLGPPPDAGPDVPTDLHTDPATDVMSDGVADPVDDEVADVPDDTGDTTTDTAEDNGDDASAEP